MDLSPDGPIVSEWLSMNQLRELLENGEVEINSAGGTLRLYVNFIDRLAVKEILEKK